MALPLQELTREDVPMRRIRTGLILSVGVAVASCGGSSTEFPELPSRGEYEAVAALLGELLAPPSASVDPVTHR